MCMIDIYLWNFVLYNKFGELCDFLQVRCVIGMFKRGFYYKYISWSLQSLSDYINRSDKKNLLDINIHSENFYADFLNILFGYHLINLNKINMNTEGIDLVDDSNKIVAQVSSTCTKEKIEKSLKKEILKKYSGYNFKFVAITGDAKNLRKKTFENPYGVIFLPECDIYDIGSLENEVLYMPTKRQESVYEFVKSELPNNIDEAKFNSNITTMINILYQEDLGTISDENEANAFEIEKKIEFNNLTSSKSTIDDMKVYNSMVDQKYAEFDSMGKNKSLSVLNYIRNCYIKLSRKNNSEDDVFDDIINVVIETVQNSKNYIEIPYEELLFCATILVVDAFIRCKIFKNPENYQYAITR